MIVGALPLLGGFTAFTGVPVVPPAKDAGTIFRPLMALIFVPFYAISLIISDPRASNVEIFTFFPLSAPTPPCSAKPSAPSHLESGIIIAELFIVGLLISRLALHLFRYCSIQYAGKLSNTGTLRKRSPLTGK